MHIKMKYISGGLLFLMIFSMFVPFLVAATEVKYSSESVTIQNQPGLIGYAAVTSHAPYYGSAQITSNDPGIFNSMSYLGSLGTPQTVPNTTDANLFYPIRMNKMALTPYGDDFDNFQSTFYVYAKNNSMANGSYSLDFANDVYEMSVGDNLEFFSTSLVPEIRLRCEKAGVYQLWYNNIGGMVFNILDSSGHLINYISDKLPDTTPSSGVSMGYYKLFVAFDPGIYRVFLNVPSGNLVQLKLSYYSVDKAKFNTAYNLGPEPGSSEFLNPNYDIKALSVPTTNDKAYSYIYSKDYGAPKVYIAQKIEQGTYITTLATGTNEILPISSAFPCFIIIDNPDYFYWDSNNAISNPYKLSFKFKEIIPQAHDLNDNETIALDSQVGAVSRVLTVTKPGVLNVLLDDVTPNNPDVYMSWGSCLSLIYGNEIWGYQAMNTLYNSGSHKHYSFLVVPGRYLISFYDSGATGNQYLQFATSFSELGSIDFQDIDINEYPELNFSNPGLMNVTHELTLDHNKGVGVKTQIPNTIDTVYFNVTIKRNRNNDIFDQKVDPNLAFLWDETAIGFVDYSNEILSSNSGIVPVKGEGAIVGDALIIGSFDKFWGLDVDLYNTSDTDAFEWEYYDSNTGWTPFSVVGNSFSDGTRNATGSLQNDGTITWNPDTMPNWDYYQSTSNTSVTELPDTKNRPLYLIRIRCNDTAATTPYLNSVTLKKFIKVSINIQTRLFYESNLEGDPTYLPYEAGEYTTTNKKLDSFDQMVSVYDYVDEVDANYQDRPAYLLINLYDLRVYDYNHSNSGTLVRLNKSLSVDYGVYKKSYILSFVTYNIGDNKVTKSSEFIDTDSYSYFDYMNSFNVSEKKWVYFDIIPRDKFAVTQINFHVENANVLNSYLIFPANVSTDAYPFYVINYDTGVKQLGSLGTNANFTKEIGFITNHVYLGLYLSNTSVLDNSANFPKISLWIGQYDTPILTVDPAKLPIIINWVILGSVLAGVAVGILVVTIFLWRKKKRGY
ncbi:MAG: hypothetical protein ACTSXF_04810 [Promethearchaeota archaeon]